MTRSRSPEGVPAVSTLGLDPDTGRPVGRVAIRVRYAETDRMGVAYNGHYLTWFEIGRTEFMRSAGIPYREVEERGYNLPLTSATLRLPKAVRYDDVLTIETWLERVRSRAVTFGYQVLHEERIAAQGETVHACVCASEGGAVNLPAWLLGKLREMEAPAP